MLKVELEGLDELEKKLSPARFNKAVEFTIQKGLMTFERESIKLAHKRTPGAKTHKSKGLLAGSISHKMQGRQKGIVGPNMIYAAMQEFGGPSKSITIRPKHTKTRSGRGSPALKIPTKEGIIYRKSVTLSPGCIPAKRYMGRAFENKVEEVKQSARKIMQAFLAGK